MTHTITLAGDITSGLSYFALLGAARIARSLSEDTVTLHWSQASQPQPVLSTSNVSLTELATEVHRLAKDWAAGWTKARANYGSGQFSPFSPRFKAIDSNKYPDDWVTHQEVRHAVMDELESKGDILALDFIHSLGEAAYWRFDRKAPRPDHGASRWEMKTRNQGQEFVQDRFHLLCIELSDWSVKDVEESITGNRVVDSLSKGHLNSRTSTGLTPPGPADVALTFVALLGMIYFPLFHRTSLISLTPCAYPTDVLHPFRAVFPVPVIPLTPERLENVIISADWSHVVEALGPKERPEESKADATLLKRWGIPAAVVFPIRKSGSDNAPERNFEKGEVVLLS